MTCTVVRTTSPWSRRRSERGWVPTASAGYGTRKSLTRGYRITDSTDRLLPPRILSHLRTRRFGKPLYYAHALDSTQEEAVLRIRRGAPEGTVVVCEYQHKGRGRRGREWLSPPYSNILMSVVVRVTAEDDEAFVWTQIASLAVAEAVEAFVQACVWIKWPNDLYMKGRKLCGILAERVRVSGGDTFMVVGIGLNVNATPPKGGDAICLKEMTSCPPGRADLVRYILRGFEWWCGAFRLGGSGGVWESWKRRSWLLGKRVHLEEGERTTQGRVEAFLPDGRLVLVCDDGCRHAYAAADVRVKQPFSFEGRPRW